MSHICVIESEGCGRDGVDASVREKSIEWAIQKGFRNNKGENL